MWNVTLLILWCLFFYYFCSIHAFNHFTIQQIYISSQEKQSIVICFIEWIAKSPILHYDKYYSHVSTNCLVLSSPVINQSFQHSNIWLMISYWILVDVMQALIIAGDWRDMASNKHLILSLAEKNVWLHIITPVWCSWFFNGSTKSIHIDTEE